MRRVRQLCILLAVATLAQGCQTAPPTPMPKAPSATEQVRTAIDGLATELTASLQISQGLRVGLMPVRDLTGGMVGGFSLTLFHGLRGSLTRTNRVTVLTDPEGFAALREEMAEQARHHELLAEGSRPKPGAHLRPSVLLETSISRIGEDFMIESAMYDVLTGLPVGFPAASARATLSRPAVYGANIASVSELSSVAILPFLGEAGYEPGVGRADGASPEVVARRAAEELTRELGLARPVSLRAVDLAVSEHDEDAKSATPARGAVAVGMKVRARYVVGGTVRRITFDESQGRFGRGPQFTSTAVTSRVHVWAVDVWSGKVNFNLEVEGHWSYRGPAYAALSAGNVVADSVIDAVRQLRNEDQFKSIVLSGNAAATGEGSGKIQ